MKKTVSIAVTALVFVCVILSGCTGTYDKSPDQIKKARWVTPDYSFIINPTDDCKGSYKFGDTKYNIKVEFKNSNLTVFDTDNKNTELFSADWMYEDKDLYIYNISFNTKDYKDFKTNYSEFVTLKKEKI